MTLIWFLIFVYFRSIYAQQFYDPSLCSANTSYPGSRYICKSDLKSCHTFLVYRAKQKFLTISNVSRLFQVDSGQLLQFNKVTSQFDVVEEGREVVVPITCSCTESRVFQANLSYIVPENTTLKRIACKVFEGLVKANVLVEENPYQGNEVQVGAKVHVPLKCSCPDNFSSGVKYLVTYPIEEGDGPKLLCDKFGIFPENLSAANHFQPWQTVYPTTTVLVPLQSEPDINFNIQNTTPLSPDFLPTITVENTDKAKFRNLYITGSVVGFSLLVSALLACVLYVKAIRKGKLDIKLLSFNARSSPLSCSTPRSTASPRSGHTGKSSTTSCLSPDLLIGIKYSLRNFSIDDLKQATKDFSEENKIGEQTHKGLFDNVEMMVKQMRFEETRQIIDVHSKINHINIVNLQGVCYGENHFSWSYLVFELPSNGSLRECLSNSSNPLRWHKRTQIAFDIATGLHYLHYCIFPTYAHMSVSSRDIFITGNWRAKLTNINTNVIAETSKVNETVESTKSWVAPEYAGTASEKVDIFAFGVVLLELVSGREDKDGKSFKESIRFLGGGACEGGCFDHLKSFMDPNLKEDYPLAEALCLAVLAKACVEDDPLHRPSMNDILKVLARMV